MSLVKHAAKKCRNCELNVRTISTSSSSSSSSSSVSAVSKPSNPSSSFEAAKELAQKDPRMKMIFDANNWKDKRRDMAMFQRLSEPAKDIITTVRLHYAKTHPGKKYSLFETKSSLFNAKAKSLKDFGLSFEYLQNKLEKYACDPIGARVIELLLFQGTNSERLQIQAELLSKWETVALSPSGCPILIKCLRYSDRSKVQQIFQSMTSSEEKFFSLASHPTGSFAVASVVAALNKKDNADVCHFVLKSEGYLQKLCFDSNAFRVVRLLINPSLGGFSDEIKTAPPTKGTTTTTTSYSSSSSSSKTSSSASKVEAAAVASLDPLMSKLVETASRAILTKGDVYKSATIPNVAFVIQDILEYSDTTPALTKDLLNAFKTAGTNRKMIQLSCDPIGSRVLEAVIEKSKSTPKLQEELSSMFSQGIEGSVFLELASHPSGSFVLTKMLKTLNQDKISELAEKIALAFNSKSFLDACLHQNGSYVIQALFQQAPASVTPKLVDLLCSLLTGKEEDSKVICKQLVGNQHACYVVQEALKKSISVNDDSLVNALVHFIVESDEADRMPAWFVKNEHASFVTELLLRLGSNEVKTKIGNKLMSTCIAADGDQLRSIAEEPTAHKVLQAILRYGDDNDSTHMKKILTLMTPGQCSQIARTDFASAFFQAILDGPNSQDQKDFVAKELSKVFATHVNTVTYMDRNSSLVLRKFNKLTNVDENYAEKVVDRILGTSDRRLKEIIDDPNGCLALASSLCLADTNVTKKLSKRLEEFFLKDPAYLVASSKKNTGAELIKSISRGYDVNTPESNKFIKNWLSTCSQDLANIACSPHGSTILQSWLTNSTTADPELMKELLRPEVFSKLLDSSNGLYVINEAWIVSSDSNKTAILRLLESNKPIFQRCGLSTPGKVLYAMIHTFLGETPEAKKLFEETLVSPSSMMFQKI